MQHTITIEAGAAFGSGGHPSTSLALGLMGELRFRNVLDMGCGSGILAVAAAKMLPDAQVLAADLSAEAVAATRRNAEQNGVAERIRVIRADGFKRLNVSPHAPFDLVICNVLAESAIAWAQDVAKIMASGGRLILSGLLVWQADAVREAYRIAGFKEIKDMRAGDWLALLLQTD